MIEYVLVPKTINYYDVYVDGMWLGSCRTPYIKDKVYFYQNYEKILFRKNEVIQKVRKIKEEQRSNKIKEKMSVSDNAELKEILIQLIEKGIDRDNPRISDWLVGQIMKQHKKKFDPLVIKQTALELLK